MCADKIKIDICCGTTCYLLGAADLIQLEARLPEEWRDKVEISAVPCLEACTTDKLGQAPFVRINGALIPRASAESICECLFELISGQWQGGDR